MGRLIALAAGRKTEAIETLKKEISGKRAELREQTPFNRWNDFLKWKAENWDEVALKVLRSKKEPIRTTTLPKSFTPDTKISDLKLKQSRIRSDSSLTCKDKRRLLDGENYIPQEGFFVARKKCSFDEKNIQKFLDEGHGRGSEAEDKP